MTDECKQEIKRLMEFYGPFDRSRPVVMVDLDSTIADTRHRSAHIHRGEGTDWEAYAMDSHNDVPITAVVQLIDALSLGNAIHIVSGRHMASREITEKWLKKHSVYYDVLALCPDTEAHVEWKCMWRDAMELNLCEVSLLIDDHPVFREAMAPTPVVIIDPGFY